MYNQGLPDKVKRELRALGYLKQGELTLSVFPKSPIWNSWAVSVL